MTPRLLAFVAALVAALAPLAGCDFEPALDIDLPEHTPATVINAVLAADSVAVVRLDVSTDPYVLGDGRPGRAVEGATVTLLRDGRPVEPLALQSRRCGTADGRPDGPGGTECGPFVGTVPVEAGGRYTVRAEVPGLPTAEGTVTIPRRPVVTAEEVGATGQGRRQLRVRVQDPAGRGDRYGLSLLQGGRRQTFPICDRQTEPPTCRDTTVVEPRRPVAFSSADPVLLAAERSLDLGDNTFGFVTVTDASFDGRTWAFTMTEVPSFYYGRGRPSDGYALTVQVAALSGDVYDAHQILTFGGQDTENPFIEPVNLPSNVTGGYGLVGGIALAEVTFAAPAETPAGRVARRARR